MGQKLCCVSGGTDGDLPYYNLIQPVDIIFRTSSTDFLECVYSYATAFVHRNIVIRSIESLFCMKTVALILPKRNNIWKEWWGMFYLNDCTLQISLTPITCHFDGWNTIGQSFTSCFKESENCLQFMMYSKDEKILWKELGTSPRHEKFRTPH